MNLLVWCPRPRSPLVSAALFLPSLLLYTGRRSSPQDFFFFYLLTKPFFSYYYFLSHSKFGPSKVGKEHLLLGAVWCQGLQTPFGTCSQRNDANANFYCNCMQDIWQGGSIRGGLLTFYFKTSPTSPERQKKIFTVCKFLSRMMIYQHLCWISLPHMGSVQVQRLQFDLCILKITLAVAIYLYYTSNQWQ